MGFLVQLGVRLGLLVEMNILVFLLSNNDEEIDRVNKMTFVDVFIVINFLEFFNANDFEEGVGQSERRCV